MNVSTTQSFRGQSFLGIVIVLLMGCQSMPDSGSTKTAIAVHGHRGSRGTHPENTLPAFQEAISAGVQALELDMQLSKDDVVVVSHDPVLGALCKDAKGRPPKKPVALRTLTLEQIKQYDCGALPNPRFPKQTLVPGTSLPTLEEVLLLAKEKAPGISFNIETKMVVPNGKKALVPDPEHFVKQVLAVLRKHGVVAQTILQSFDFRTLEAARKQEPALTLSALFEHKADFCAETARLGAKWLSPMHTLLTPEIMKDCKARGISVVPWTANKPEEWQALVALGVEAIITDYPRDLIAFLKK